MGREGIDLRQVAYVEIVEYYNFHSGKVFRVNLSIALNAPIPVQSLELSKVERGKYLDG